MKLLIEMATDLELEELKKEINETVTQYKNLIRYTALYEGAGITDNLPNGLIKRIEEIDRRMQVIEKAKRLVDKLEKSGWDKKKVRYHKKRLYSNKKEIQKTLKIAKKQMRRLEKEINVYIDSINLDDGLSYSES